MTRNEFYLELKRVVKEGQVDMDNIEKLWYEMIFEEAVEIAKNTIQRFYHLSGETPMENNVLLYELSSIEAPNVDFLMQLIRSSNDTESAWHALRQISENIHRKRIFPIPAELSDWIVDVLADIPLPDEEKKRKCPTGRGRKPDANLFRDQSIYLTVTELEHRGMYPTRISKPGKFNPCCATGGSACDAVGIASNEIHGQNLKYKTIEGIYLKIKGKGS